MKLSVKKTLPFTILLCLILTGCKQKQIEVTAEEFEPHPTWTADNPDAFWGEDTATMKQ